MYFKPDRHQHAAEAAILRALAVVAAEAFDGFEATATATANGVPMWVVLTSMIDTSAAHDRVNLANRLLDLADTVATGPRLQDWVHLDETEPSWPWRARTSYSEGITYRYSISTEECFRRSDIVADALCVLPGARQRSAKS